MASEIEEKHAYNSNSNELSGPKNEFAINVGGRGATQRRLRDYQIAMIVSNECTLVVICLPCIFDG